ncbi:hypothetical protein LSTR_LSTR010069 [Laodelphax striatellus]|uniref:Uncharacterized protein n=1 Tax=Laodelphax striatellus TaxID=195883 RepID=A0A482WN64_LAOST|nr:hypothetical protein LSTR_LSTR010069 [Laodelphax striatellus]
MREVLSRSDGCDGHETSTLGEWRSLNREPRRCAFISSSICVCVGYKVSFIVNLAKQAEQHTNKSRSFLPLGFLRPANREQSWLLGNFVENEIIMNIVPNNDEVEFFSKAAGKGGSALYPIFMSTV